MAATITNREGKATSGTCSYAEIDAGHDEEEPKSSRVPRSALIVGSGQDEYVVQEEATVDGMPAGWTRTKLEPDW